MFRCSGMLILLFVFVFVVADIMSKFSARFDAKATKGCKGQGKA
jgi:hypothetical protein